jgi:hypothetical protein
MTTGRQKGASGHGACVPWAVDSRAKGKFAALLARMGYHRCG